MACSSATCIDHVFSNLHDTDLFVETITTAVSDHYGNFLLLPNHTFDTKDSYCTQTKRSFKAHNYESFETLLAKCDWTFIYNNNTTVDERFTLFLSKIVNLFNQAFPKRSVNINCNRKPWRTAAIKAMGQRVKLLYDDYRFCKSSAVRKLYRTEKKAYDKSIKAAMKEHFSKKLENAENKIKCAWKLINNKRNNKKSSNSCEELVMNGDVIKDPSTICEVFNNFFVNVSTSAGGSKVPSVLEQMEEYSSRLCITEFHKEDIEKAISDIKNKSATGDDEISISLICKYSHHFLPHLVFLFNTCLHEGCFPSVLKIAKVRPLFKKGDPREVNNYRPIALTSSFSKIFEKALASQITNFLEDNNLLHPHQYGYRRSISTADAIAYSLETIVQGLEDKHSTVGVFLDLSKAFDKVEYEILLAILQKLGLHQSLINLVRSFLTNRKQFVVINYNDLEFRSSMATPSCSVPQGSILGPLLFLIYINFIPILAEANNVCMFCDDTTLIYKAPTIIENEISIHSSLNSYIQTLGQFNLAVNQSKTNFICFKSHGAVNNCNLSVFIDSAEITQVNHIKFLGVYIDETLTWNYHVANLLDKLSSVLFLLKRIAQVCTLPVRLMVYHSCFHSNISYCLIIWGNTSVSNLTQVLIYQKNALRLIFHLKRDASCKEHFKKYSIFTIFAQYVYLLLINIKKHEDKLSDVGSSHQYNTRKGYLLKSNLSRLKVASVLPMQNGIKYFNLLPLTIRNLGLSSFKKTLKSELCALAPYDFQEISKFLPTLKVNNK